jgi:hypothetical protein
VDEVEITMLTVKRPAFFKHKVALLLLGAFIVFMSVSLPKFFREIRSARWPSAAGVITQSALREAYVKSFSGFIPEVQYRYTVAGREFTGSQITFHLSQSIHTKDFAESCLKDYPTGKVVSVYYEPEAPGVSVLQPGIQSEQRWLLNIGLGYIVACTIAFLWVFYDYRKNATLVARFGTRSFVRLEQIR